MISWRLNFTNPISLLNVNQSQVMITIWTDVHQTSIPAAEVEHYQNYETDPLSINSGLDAHLSDL